MSDVKVWIARIDFQEQNRDGLGYMVFGVKPKRLELASGVRWAVPGHNTPWMPLGDWERELFGNPALQPGECRCYRLVPVEDDDA
jgi:hypothetical protein